MHKSYNTVFSPNIKQNNDKPITFLIEYTNCSFGFFSTRDTFDSLEKSLIDFGHQNNIERENNDYYELPSWATARRIADTLAYVPEIPDLSHVSVHSPQTTYLDPINPGSSYPAPRRA